MVKKLVIEHLIDGEKWYGVFSAVRLKASIQRCLNKTSAWLHRDELAGYLNELDFYLSVYDKTISAGIINIDDFKKHILKLLRTLAQTYKNVGNQVLNEYSKRNQAKNLLLLKKH